MKVKELCERLHWTILCGDGEKEAEGCYICDLMSRVMGRCGDTDVWITVQTSKNMVAVAELSDVPAVVFPEGITVGEEVISQAEREGITLASCGETAFYAACGLARELGIGQRTTA